MLGYRPSFELVMEKWLEIYCVTRERLVVLNIDYIDPCRD